MLRMRRLASSLSYLVCPPSLSFDQASSWYVYEDHVTRLQEIASTVLKPILRPRKVKCQRDKANAIGIQYHLQTPTLFVTESNFNIYL